MRYRRTPLSDEQKAKLREQAITRLRRQLHELDEGFDKIPREDRDRKVPMCTEGDIDFFHESLDLLIDAGVETSPNWWMAKEGGRTHNKGRRHAEFKTYNPGALQMHIEWVLSDLVPGFTEERNEVRARIRRGEPRIAPATQTAASAADTEDQTDT